MKQPRKPRSCRAPAAGVIWRIGRELQDRSGSSDSATRRTTAKSGLIEVRQGRALARTLHILELSSVWLDYEQSREYHRGAVRKVPIIRDIGTVTVMRRYD
jgi:hypothetical protein